MIEVAGGEFHAQEVTGVVFVHVVGGRWARGGFTGAGTYCWFLLASVVKLKLIQTTVRPGALYTVNFIE